MNPSLPQKMDDAWRFIWDQLFHQETHLFYDYLTSHDPAHRLDHLPTPDEIHRQFPNPCGWGTGMEDSMLNAGSVMDILRLRADLAGDRDAGPLAEKVLDGMCRCGSVHGKPGFIVRSVSPRDGQSCYINSSRDQFTLCVYGAWRFSRCFPASSSAPRARELLVNIARYCEQTLTPQNDNLLRLDGQPALVSSMVHVGAHEALRLPMFYAAAWDASRDPHWFELYRRYATAGIEKTLAMQADRYWWDIEFSQMQLSLELLRCVDPDPAWRPLYEKAMLRTAELSDRYLRDELKKAGEFTGDWSTHNHLWRRMSMVIRDETLAAPGDSSLFAGYPYMMPQFPAAYMKPYWSLRAVGNLLVTESLCPHFTPAPDLLEAFATLATRPDYSTHCSPAPINLLHAYWLTRQRHLLNDALPERHAG